VKAVVILLLATASCADHKPSPVSAGSGSPGSGATMNASVTVTLVGEKPGRPPISRLLVDVQLKNDDPAPRWVLIPSKLPVTAGGIDKLEQLTASAGATNVAVGRFLGTGGRYALRLAPGARVTLRKLEVGWWRENNEKDTSFDVQLAGEVKLGGQPMATWFDKDPTISGAAEVDMESAKHTASHRAPDDAEVPLVATSATSATIKLTAP
jgi:hypothetical protein